MTEAPRLEEPREPFLVALGDRVRRLRARRGMTRRGLAEGAGVSERHLANLEAGLGNPTVLILRQVAAALDCSIAELVGDATTANADWLLLRELLRDRGPAELEQARRALADLFGRPRPPGGQPLRIALIGLRGAGKSTLGRLLAEALKLPFVELARDIEQAAGCRPDEIHALYGATAYRRYERRVLDETIAHYPAAVIATPGGIVAEAATFDRLLAACFTVWLKAAPEEHMARVMAQGDFRPMAGNREAMGDLKLILAERTPFYAKADLTFDTSGRTVADSLAALKGRLTERVQAG